MRQIATKLEELAANAETEADYLRQGAEHLRRGDFGTHREFVSKAETLNGKREDGVSEIKELADALRLVDKEFFDSIRRDSIDAQVKAMSVEEAKRHLMAHGFQCSDGENCDVHKALIRRINNG